MVQDRWWKMICGSVCGLVLATAIGVTAVAQSDEAPAERIGRLIEQLGADAFSERRAAERALIEIGEPAREALEAASASDNPEVSARAESALAAIDERRRAARFERFVETGELPDASLPLIEAYAEAVGEVDDGARRLFARMVGTERELLEAAERAARLSADPDADESELARAREAYLRLADDRFNAISAAHRQEVNRAKIDLYSRYELTDELIGRFMATLLAWQVTPAEWQPERPGQVAQLMAFGIVVGKQDQRNGWPPFARWFTSDAEEVGPAKKLMQSVAARLPGTNESLPFLTGAMIVRLDQASLTLARAMAERREQLSDDAEVLALHAMMVWGDKEKDLALAGRFLDSTGDKRLGGWKGPRPDRRSIKVAEVALMTLRKLETGRTADRNARKVVTYCPVARWVPTYWYTQAGQLKAEIEKWKEKLPEDQPADAAAEASNEGQAE